MTELRLVVDDAFMNDIMKKTGASSIQVMRDAFTIFNWAVDESAKERLILSSDKNGEDLTRLSMTSLNKVFNAARSENMKHGIHAPLDVTQSRLKLKKPSA